MRNILVCMFTVLLCACARYQSNAFGSATNEGSRPHIRGNNQPEENSTPQIPDNEGSRPQIRDSGPPVQNSTPQIPRAPENKPGPLPQPISQDRPTDNEPESIVATLVAKQISNFPRIINELKTQHKKTSHWIWWVFPTEKPGASEPNPKTHIEPAQADKLMQKAPMGNWSEILETIFQLLKDNPVGPWKEAGHNRPNPNIIPEIDHGRIKFSLNFWLSKAEKKTMTNMRFFTALENLAKFDW